MDEQKPMRELTRIRKERSLSQQRLADASGVNNATINQIERGRRSPNARTLEKLAAALGVEVADLFPKAQSQLPLEESFSDLLEKKGFPAEQIAAYLAQNERDEEFIRRELEKMSAKDFREALLASPGMRRVREYYRESEANKPPRSETA
jgi:transcriptional regulator with XRE-family HTH domain